MESEEKIVKCKKNIGGFKENRYYAAFKENGSLGRWLVQTPNNTGLFRFSNIGFADYFETLDEEENSDSKCTLIKENLKSKFSIDVLIVPRIIDDGKDCWYTFVLSNDHLSIANNLTLWPSRELALKAAIKEARRMVVKSYSPMQFILKILDKNNTIVEASYGYHGSFRTDAFKFVRNIFKKY